ncbi:hypothetical protein BOX15_Mlig008158g1 [Macrostomum lignano]|uniref:Uncharacterized protein n=1 Tax=Macrostomum lignano TaxID=282301 RepID=A0A267E178_9PLAT|nr:hypothetical protein BOX15_Mlig008158g1 [Macrostomum lignano]
MLYLFLSLLHLVSRSQTFQLKAKPLIDALQYMHQNKMYRKLVFYLEAAESAHV